MPINLIYRSLVALAERQTDARGALPPLLLDLGMLGAVYYVIGVHNGLLALEDRRP